MTKKIDVEILKETPDDVEGVFYVNKTTWLATYPNKQLGITKEILETRFTEKEKKIRKWKDWVKTFGEKAQGWVAKHSGNVIGYVVAVKDNNELRVRALYVLPEFQGKKIGAGLMNKALAWLGKGEIHISVANYNDKAIKFYEKFGFRVVGKSNDKVDLGNGVFIDEVEMLK